MRTDSLAWKLDCGLYYGRWQCIGWLARCFSPPHNAHSIITHLYLHLPQSLLRSQHNNNNDKQLLKIQKTLNIVSRCSLARVPFLADFLAFLWHSHNEIYSVSTLRSPNWCLLQCTNQKLIRFYVKRTRIWYNHFTTGRASKYTHACRQGILLIQYPLTPVPFNPSSLQPWPSNSLNLEKHCISVKTFKIDGRISMALQIKLKHEVFVARYHALPVYRHLYKGQLPQEEVFGCLGYTSTNTALHNKKCH